MHCFKPHSTFCRQSCGCICGPKIPTIIYSRYYIISTTKKYVTEMWCLSWYVIWCIIAYIFCTFGLLLLFIFGRNSANSVEYLDWSILSQRAKPTKLWSPTILILHQHSTPPYCPTVSVHEISQGLNVQVARLFQICEREELPRGTLPLLQLRNVKMLMAFIKSIHKHDHNNDHNNYGKKRVLLFWWLWRVFFKLSNHHVW